MAAAKTRQKILKTFLKLLAEHPYQDVSLPLLARTADVKLSTLRECYSSKRALVEGFAEMIDTAVLDDRDEDMDDQPARDRLFDVLMSRIDQLEPHKEAVRSLNAAVRSDPALAFDLNSIAVTSQRWMLIAAGIETTGIRGGLMSQGLAIAFARVVDTWLDETDEGMPKTMAKLDKELDRGESWMKWVARAEKAARPIWETARKRRSRRTAEEPADDWDTDPAEAGVAGRA